MDTVDNKPMGALNSSLARNAKAIRLDRAQAIAEDTEITYKRKLEDMDQEIRRLKRKRAAMLDLSPNDSTSLILAANYDPYAFHEQDKEITTTIRKLSVEKELMQARYNYLFVDGDIDKLEQIENKL